MFERHGYRWSVLFARPSTSEGRTHRHVTSPRLCSIVGRSSHSAKGILMLINFAVHAQRSHSDRRPAIICPERRARAPHSGSGIVLAALAALCLMIGPHLARSATLSVTITNDSGPGSLREAILTAN